MESFMSTQQAIKDLEQQIEEVSTMAPSIRARSDVESDTILGLQAKQGGSKLPHKANRPAEAIPPEEEGEPTFDNPDDWLKAEEEAVKRLEKEIAKKRRHVSPNAGPSIGKCRLMFAVPSLQQPHLASRSRLAGQNAELESTPSPTLLTRTSQPLFMASPGSPLKSMRFPASPRRRIQTKEKSDMQTPLRMAMNAPQSPETPVNAPGSGSATTTPTRTGTSSSPGRSLGASGNVRPATTVSTPRFAQTTTSLAAKINALTPHRSKASPSANERRRVTSYAATQDVSPGPFLAAGASGSGPMSGRGRRVGLFGLGRSVNDSKETEVNSKEKASQGADSTTPQQTGRRTDPVGESTVMEARPDPDPNPSGLEEVGDETITGPVGQEPSLEPDQMQETRQEPAVVEGVKVDSPAVKYGIVSLYSKSGVHFVKEGTADKHAREKFRTRFGRLFPRS